jgi:hypothetical protein
LCQRQPTTRPHDTSTTRISALNTRSPTTRPAITADLAMGSERNLSIRPFCMSSANPTELEATENAIVSAKMPPMRYSR